MPVMSYVWNFVLLFGASYVVFDLGHSGWWFVLAILMMYTPK